MHVRYCVWNSVSCNQGCVHLGGYWVLPPPRTVQLQIKFYECYIPTPQNANIINYFDEGSGR